jgi:hypothetical protein
MLTHDKNDLGSATGQLIRETHAPRKMPHAHFNGGVNPNCNLFYDAH